MIKKYSFNNKQGYLTTDVADYNNIGRMYIPGFMSKYKNKEEISFSVMRKDFKELDRINKSNLSKTKSNYYKLTFLTEKGKELISKDIRGEKGREIKGIKERILQQIEIYENQTNKQNEFLIEENGKIKKENLQLRKEIETIKAEHEKNINELKTEIIDDVMIGMGRIILEKNSNLSEKMIFNSEKNGNLKKLF